MTGGKYCYTVHAVTESVGAHGVEQGHIELVELEAHRANDYARKRSGDIGVKVSIVTRLEVGKLGTRHLIGWWVDGIQYGMGDVRLANPAAELPRFLPEFPLPSAG
jgi:hypothetical protein